jgi:hypothetical protein
MCTSVHLAAPMPPNRATGGASSCLPDLTLGSGKPAAWSSDPAAGSGDSPARLHLPRSHERPRPDMMTSDLIPRPASSRVNRRAGAEKRICEPEAAMKRPGRRKSWSSEERPIGSRSASGGTMSAIREGMH